MKIITGQYKHKPIVFPKDGSLRPSKTQVREAIFNILQMDISGAKFLDLCCGTGSVGLEALSRGAGHVSFVDLDTSWVRKNARGISASYSIMKQDCITYLQSHKIEFDIVFFDPPWHESDLYQQVVPYFLEAIQAEKVGILIVEQYKKSKVQELLSLNQAVDYHYGDTTLSVIRR